MEKEKILVPPIKCQGIKTKLVPLIKKNIEWDGDGNWIEPFLGSGVVLFNVNPKEALVGDTNQHIIEFYELLQKGIINPDKVRNFLEEEGEKLEKLDGEHYYLIREKFNKDFDSLDFLFLNRSCFNGVMRFNRKGKFNVPYGHNRNRFRQAYITKITNQIKAVQKLSNIKKWKFKSKDWEKILDKAKKEDFVYLDPPYIGRHTDYYNSWNEEDADKMVEICKSLPCKFIVSMWAQNRYRTNPYLEKWKKYKMISFNHFYHVGSTEELRNSMEEVLILKSN